MPFYHGLKDYRDLTLDPSDPEKEPYPEKAKWIANRLIALRHDLSQSIAQRKDPDSLIIGSWNLVAFDGGRPRLDESMHYIAEIIGAMDICAIQEIKPDLGPLKRLCCLGITGNFWCPMRVTMRGPTMNAWPLSITPTKCSSAAWSVKLSFRKTT